MITQQLMLRQIHHRPTSEPGPARFLATAPQPLDRAFNRAVHHIAGVLLPNGFDVGDNASGYIGLRAHYEATGRICVWSGGSEHTIFADRETNYAFRAWHDWRHLTGNHDFTPEGELEVYWAQEGDISRVYGAYPREWRTILWAEIVGQGEYERANGTFPQDQMAFVKCYLQVPTLALTKEF